MEEFILGNSFLFIVSYTDGGWKALESHINENMILSAMEREIHEFCDWSRSTLDSLIIQMTDAISG